MPGVGRVFLSREGGMVEGFIKLLVGFGEIALRRQNHPPETESPSGDGITLRVGWRRLVIGDFARIGRVELSVEGGMVG